MTAAAQGPLGRPATTPVPRQPPAPPPATRETCIQGSADAWEALKLVTEWIKHAETKASVTLAGSGLIGGVLYTLVTSRNRNGAVFAAAATICAACVFVAACAASMVLRPRVHARRAPTSLLYYHDVARRFRADVDGYTHALTALLADPNALVPAIAAQVWANAHVARAKYRWTNIGMLALLGALVAGAAAAAVAATHTT
jgi:Pycsar effector protein